MPDNDNEPIVVLEDNHALIGAPAPSVFKRRFNRDAADKVMDRWLAHRLRRLDRVRQLSIFKDGNPSPRAIDAKVLPSDPPEVQALFAGRDLYKQADAIEDATERINTKLQIWKGVTSLAKDLSNSEADIVELLRSFMQNEDKSKDIDPDELYKLIGQVR